MTRAEGLDRLDQRDWAAHGLDRLDQRAWAAEDGIARTRSLLLAAATVVGLVVLFALFIAVRDDGPLVAALSAAGTVAAGVFAATAAIAAMRAATESRAAAQQTQRAAARAVQPQLAPRWEPGRGAIDVGHASAIDVSTVWQVEDSPPVTAFAPRIERGSTFTVELPPGEVKLLWAEYRDVSGDFRWQDTWDSALRRTESRVTD